MPRSRPHPTPTARHATLAALLLPLVASCGDRDEPTIVEPRQAVAVRAGTARPGDAPALAMDPFDGVGGVQGFGALSGKLPSTDTITSSVPAFEIKQKGGGIAGRFEITNPNSAAIALDGVSGGNGHALLAWNYGKGRGAVVITSSPQNTLPALDVSSLSVGTTTLASAMDVRANNTTTSFPAVQLTTLGRGPLFVVDHKGTVGDLAVFRTNGANKIRFNRNGAGLFNGGVQTGGADLAEAFETEGRAGNYEPGDVLAISTRNDRRVTRSGRAYSTAVIGVYATRPGVLLSAREPGDTAGLVPVGVVGVIPTKVSAENGAIRRGDLLVSASTRGHAMRGTNRSRMLGAVIGKALAGFDGPGTGVIDVLVNVR